MNKKLIQLYKQSLKEREPMTGRWESCRRYTLPSTADEAAQIFDSTAGDAVEMLSANMFSLLTPPESLWMTLARAGEFAPEPELATAELRRHINNSNFYTTVHQSYLDLATIGTACLFMSENEIGAQSAFSFTSIPMGDISILRDARGEITAVFHTTSMPATCACERYPAWVPPATLKESLKQNPEMPLRIIQSVVADSNGFAFTAWIDTTGNFENNIVAKGRFETNPYIIFRWSAMTGEVYGRSPVMRALPDIKTANKVVELILKNATIAVSGMWQADDDGVINLSNINLTPGAIIPKAVGSSGLTPLRAGADFNVSQLVLGDLRDRIRHALLADKMTIISNKDMTATEVIARNTDMMRTLGATYGRLLGEFIRPMIARAMSILSRRGAIDNVSLDANAMLCYQAPISQLASDERVSQIITFIKTLDSAGLPLDINYDALTNYLADSLHIPKEILNAPKSIEEEIIEEIIDELIEEEILNEQQ